MSDFDLLSVVSTAFFQNIWYVLLGVFVLGYLLGWYTIVTMQKNKLRWLADGQQLYYIELSAFKMANIKYAVIGPFGKRYEYLFDIASKGVRVRVVGWIPSGSERMYFVPDDIQNSRMDFLISSLPPQTLRTES